MEPGHQTLGQAPHRRAQAVAIGLRVLQVALLLYCFLFAISLLGGAFKLFGKGFSQALITGTSNPVIGLMIGLLATSIIQSSSSTSSIVVGLVAAGALTVEGAVPIIMGANMGTTVTNTLVAMASLNRRAEFIRAFAGATMHDFFNLLAILILFPLEMAFHPLEKAATWLSSLMIGGSGVEFQSPIKIIVSPVVDLVQHGLLETAGLGRWAAGGIELGLALILIFISLSSLTRVLKNLVVHRAEGSFAKFVRRGGMGAMVVGLLVTVSVQSSSITTSLLIPLIGAGVVPLDGAFAVTMGANVGTTVTALLASLTGDQAAVTIALVHFLFNVTGIAIIYPLKTLRRVPVAMAQGLARRTADNKLFALYYMVGMFFVLPLLFVALDRWLG
jgi:sodium-dependent phosphate cotransporter